jgi:hypothetical protein
LTCNSFGETVPVMHAHFSCFERRSKLGVFALLALLSGCEAIAGIKDRTLVSDADGSVAPAREALCKDYCDDALANCSVDMSVDVYKTHDDCMSVCKALPLGKPMDKSGNSVACRAYYAAQASNVESEENNCHAAAPGGGTPNNANKPTCGENCEGFCSLYETICPDPDLKIPDCRSKCEALPDAKGYSVARDFKGGDTIQCRLAHLTAAAQAKEKNDDGQRRMHCGAMGGHASLKPLLDGVLQYCDLVPYKPDCESFCKLATRACTEHPVYDDNQCMAVCAKFDPGTDASDSTNDTLACRRWHAYFALNSPTDAVYHCSHTSPYGDGHCGTKCGSYCRLLNKTCKSEFAGAFGSAGKDDAQQMACEQACGTLSGVDATPAGTTGYDVKGESVMLDTLQCRVRQVARAAAASGDDVKRFCEAALPKGKCPPAPK